MPGELKDISLVPSLALWLAPQVCLLQLSVCRLYALFSTLSCQAHWVGLLLEAEHCLLWCLIGCSRLRLSPISLFLSPGYKYFSNHARMCRSRSRRSLGWPFRESPWLWPSKRTKSTSRPRYFREAKSCSDCSILQRRSFSLWMISSGVCICLT